DLPKVVAHRWNRTRGRAHHGLGDECCDRVRPELEDLLLELTGEPRGEGLFGLLGALFAIRVARAHVMRFDQHRQKRLAAPSIAADRERTERVAVIALPPSDEEPALRLTALDEILSRE